MSETLTLVAQVEKAIAALQTEITGHVLKQEAEIKELGSARAETGKAMTELEKRFEQYMADLRGHIAEVEKKYGRLDQSRQQMTHKSWGETFVESETIKKIHEAGVASGSFARNSEDVVVKGLHKANPSAHVQKALTGVATLRDFWSTERLMEIFRDPTESTRVRDLFPVIPTKFEAFEYPVETSFTNNAAEVAEGALKPESAIAFGSATMNIRTIAHWLPINNQQLEDLTGLRAYVDLRLVEGLKLREDLQLLYGDGIAPNLQGLMTNTNIPKYWWSSGVTSPYLAAKADTRLDAIRRAITQAQLSFYPVTGIIVNPVDWEHIEITKNADGNYIWASVPTSVGPRVWGVPVTVTAAMAAGDALLGNFNLSVIIYDRERANIRLTDSHADYFIYNKTVILAEERLGISVPRPNALRRVGFDKAPVS